MKTCHLSDLPAVSSWFAVPLYKGASLPSELEFLKEYLEGLSLEKGKNYHIVQTDPRYPRHILILGLGDKESLPKRQESLSENVSAGRKKTCASSPIPWPVIISLSGTLPGRPPIMQNMPFMILQRSAGRRKNFLRFPLPLLRTFPLFVSRPTSPLPA